RVRRVLRDVRQHVHGGVEEDGAADALRSSSRELEHEPTAERVADPVRLVDPEGPERLEEVVHVRRERPRRLPARAAVAAQVRCDDAEVLCPPLLRELSEPLTVGGDAVQADDRRRRRVTPLVHVPHHAATILSSWSSRSARATSPQSRQTRSRTPPTTTSGWARAWPERSSAPAVRRSSGRRWRGGRLRLGRRWQRPPAVFTRGTWSTAP